MDPFSLIILAGILTALGVRTVSSAVTDVAAQVRGQTPPSLEKWRARQEARAARGEAPEKDPGPWRRRWRNAVEYRSAKAAQKHAARMELLRDNGPDNVAKHKAKLAKRADRWDRIGATVARWGEASWEAAKTGAAKVKDARDERRAWKENERRPGLDELDEPAGPDTTPATTEPSGENGPDADVLPFRRPGDDQDKEDDTDGEHGNENGENSNTNGGTSSMTAPTHSGEITDLPSALAYVNTSTNYCNSISGTFEIAQAQADSTAADLQRQLATLETAQSTLTGQGFDTTVTGHLAAVSEHFTTLVANMRQVNELLASTQEAINSARSALNTASNVFRAQTGISEQVGSHQSVATKTAFYANS